MAFKACLIPDEDIRYGIGMTYVYDHKDQWVDASKFEGSLAPGWTQGTDFFVYEGKAYMIKKTYMDLETGETIYAAFESTMGADTKKYVEETDEKASDAN